MLTEFETALDRRDLLTLKTGLRTLPKTEILQFMGRLDDRRRAIVFRLLDKDRALGIFESLDPPVAGELTRSLRDGQLRDLFENLDPDDRVALLDELPAGLVTRILQGLSIRERSYTTRLLGYPEGSIGRRMSPEYVHVGLAADCAQVLAAIRAEGADAETVYSIPVVAGGLKLAGVLRLHDVLLARPHTGVQDVMLAVPGIGAHEDAEEAARRAVAADLTAVPVVDFENRVVGILTWDDATDIVSGAEDEDAARAGGTEPLRQPYLSVPVLRLVRSRVVWLLVLAVSAILTVSVLDGFEDVLNSMVVLALFIPLLTGTGGNTGSQAATTVTRALALGDVRKRDIARVALRELRVGVAMGVLLGALAFVPAMLFVELPMAVIISTTLVCICTLSATVGGSMPILAKVVKVDPAVFSAPFISTFCDAAGLLIYFFIAKAVLGL